VLVTPGGAQAIQVNVAADVPYMTRDTTTLHLDSWSPRPRAGIKRPMVVLLHGGGWRAGSRHEWARHGWAQSIAATGYVVVAPSYRLACPDPTRAVDGEQVDEGAAAAADVAVASAEPGEIELCGHAMAEQRQDVEDSIRWTIRNARRLGGDPDRIVLLGGSAGGHLALLAASRPDLAPHLSGVAAISPPVDLESIGAEDLWLRGALEQAIRCTWLDCPERWERHSPLVELARASEVVPTYLYASRRDLRVRRTDVVSLAAVLRRRGAPVALRQPIVASSACHGPWACERFAVAEARMPLRRDVLRWIGQVTAPPRAARPAVTVD
jgi:acetyl esterase/lipase